VVEKAIEFKLGARGLRSILEGIMNDAMFELPSKINTKTFKVTASFVDEQFRKTSMAHLKVA
jgi:ATP-dependent Clp protease ATP-binding subunit ClpX